MTQRIALIMLLSCLFSILCGVPFAREEEIDFDALVRISVQHNGRVKPLDTYARETTEQRDYIHAFLSTNGLADLEESIPFIPPSGQVIRSDETHWLTLSQFKEVDSNSVDNILRLLHETGIAYENGQPATFNDLSRQLQVALAKLSPSNYPSSLKTDIEIHYNRLNPFQKTSAIYFLACLLWLLSLSIRNRLLKTLAWSVTFVGLLLHSYGFVLRGIVAGYVPLTNMYETIILMAWGTILLTLILEHRLSRSYIGLSCSLLSAMFILMAHILPIQSTIGVLAPILRSNLWLMIHVMTIMLSYSALTMAWALGHVALVKIIIRPGITDDIKQISAIIHNTLRVGVLLLTTGIILGALWAKVAWGRYWGWDPKETWSLICLLGYLAILHARRTNLLKDFGMAFWSVLAFMLVVMCYYGVNFVLSQGLHSYGAGAGGVHYAIAYVLADFAFAATALLRFGTRFSTEQNKES